MAKVTHDLLLNAFRIRDLNLAFGQIRRFFGVSDGLSRVVMLVIHNPALPSDISRLV